MFENPEITIRYELSYRDFVAGQKLVARMSIPLLLFHLVSRFIAPTIGVLFVVMCAVNLLNGHASTIPPMLPFIFLILLMPVVLWMSWRYSFKSLRSASNHDPQMTFQADRKEFTRRIDGMGDITWLWSATRGVSENKKVVVITVRKGAFIFIPRRAISDGDIAGLKSFLQESKTC